MKNIDSEVKERLEQLKKKHPEDKIRVLHIENPTEHFAFSFHGKTVASTMINSHMYFGVVFAKINQQYPLGLDDDEADEKTVIDLIVAEDTFRLSSICGGSLINKYGI